MSDDSDATRILREREQRRALERARIDEERHDRQLELSRLRLFGFGSPLRPLEEPDEPVARPLIAPATETNGTSSSDIDSRAPEPRGPATRLREIGGALRPPILAEFLQTNPVDRFDVQSLNALRFPGLVEAARGDPALLAAIGRQAEVLMERVKREVDDPLSAGAFLRDRVLRWYRESPEDPKWTEHVQNGWAGLFAESRVSGGRLQPWLNLRLWSVREEVTRTGSLRLRLRRGLTRDRRIEASVTRTPSQQIRAEVAQAILDDLVRVRREDDAPVPLVRLSELAVRREVPTVNDALALLFSAPESGPFVLLHPNRYPDCDELQIRPPTGGTTGAAMAYSLVPGRAGRKAPGRSRGAVGPGLVTGAGDLDSTAEDQNEELDATTIWESEDVEPSTWRRVIKERRRERHRLDPPPKDCRNRPAYGVLRDLLLDEAEFRQAFLAVKWRGRPSGLPLLVTLLQKGSLAPEVATDHEYLEAELGDLAQGDPQWHPADGSWTIRGWTVVRSGSHHDGFRFAAKRST
jgi:hypothetical protein